MFSLPGGGPGAAAGAAATLEESGQGSVEQEREEREGSDPRRRRHGDRGATDSGETARGTDGPDSDIDLLVSSPSPVGLLSQSEIEVDLVDRLCTPVDLVIEDDVRPMIRERILKEVVPL